MIWFVFALISLAVVALLLWPLLRGRGTVAERTGYDLAVYKDQLREVDADVERGLLTASQADAARTEIKRRMLAAGDAGVRRQASGTFGAKAIAITLVVLVPVGAAGMYALLGTPKLPDQPFASRDVGPADAPHEQMQQITALVDTLAKRLEQEPENAQGWIMLARSAKTLERYTQAVDAYRRAIALGVKEVDVFAGYGETLMYANQGEVTPEAVNAFEAALGVDRSDPRARFFLGVGRLQQGDAAAAIAIWRDLEKDAPAEAAWAQGVREQIRQAAAQAGIDPATVTPKAPEISAAAANLAKPPEQSAEQQAQIQAMVDRLAAKLKDTPDDADGWQRLARAYRVQGKLEQSKEAYGKAMALLPQDPAVKLAYADLLLAMAPDNGPDMPPEFVDVMRQVLAVDGEHAEALYHVGLAEARAGRRAEAKALWDRLLAQLPANSPERQSLQQQIEQLGG